MCVCVAVVVVVVAAAVVAAVAALPEAYLTSLAPRLIVPNISQTLPFLSPFVLSVSTPISSETASRTSSCSTRLRRRRTGAGRR